MRKLRSTRLLGPSAAVLAASGACGGIPLRANFDGYAKIERARSWALGVAR